MTYILGRKITPPPKTYRITMDKCSVSIGGAVI